MWGHDVLWWLDRMVRTKAPLVERMTLVWHDWFATSKAGVDGKWMLRQNALLRDHALGNFRSLLRAVTKDPAMLIWLNGIENREDAPNENYARELQELFTLGAGRGYTERDVRQMARALTGWRADWRDGAGLVDFRFDRALHDRKAMRIYGKHGHYDWRDAADLAVRHAKHPSFFVTKLWSYFIPTPPPPVHAARARAALQAVGARHPPGRRRHPQAPRAPHRPAHGQAADRLHRGPAARARPRDRHRLLVVADRDDGPDAVRAAERRRLGRHPLDRHRDLARALDGGQLRAGGPHAEPGSRGRRSTRARTSRAPARPSPPPTASGAGRRCRAPRSASCVGFAQRAAAAADQPWKKEQYAILRQNALRMLIATSPDLHTS